MASDPLTDTPVATFAGNSMDYNLQFTTDISKQMQMPDRLAAVDGLRRLHAAGLDEHSSHGYMSESAAFGMTMPDRITLSGTTDYSSLQSQTADHIMNGGIDYGNFDGDSYNDDYNEPYGPRHFVNSSDLPVTPEKRQHSDIDLFAAGDLVVPATPASMLRSSIYRSRSGSDGGDLPGDWVTIQRQVAKLTCRVERLEEENGRRRQREILFYTPIIGYCLVQLMRLLMSRSK